MFPEACSFMARPSLPDSSIWSWWELTWSCAERVAPWPLSSCQACQDPQVFPVNAPVTGWTGRQREEGRADEEGGRKRGWKAGSGILGSLCCDPYPSVLLWMLQYENNPITVDPCTASKTQRQRLIKTERVPIPSFVFAQCVSLSVYVCVRVCVLVANWKPLFLCLQLWGKGKNCTWLFVLGKK